MGRQGSNQRARSVRDAVDILCDRRVVIYFRVVLSRGELEDGSIVMIEFTGHVASEGTVTRLRSYELFEASITDDMA